MMNEVKFDYFGKPCTMYFTNRRLAKLELFSGKPIAEIAGIGALNMNLLIAMLRVGLEHEYGTKPEDFYYDKLDEYQKNDEFGALGKIWDTCTMAIAASGIMGNEVAKHAPKYKNYVELITAMSKAGELPEGEEKNERAERESESNNSLSANG